MNLLACLFFRNGLKGEFIFQKNSVYEGMIFPLNRSTSIQVPLFLVSIVNLFLVCLLLSCKGP